MVDEALLEIGRHIKYHSECFGLSTHVVARQTNQRGTMEAVVAQEVERVDWQPNGSKCGGVPEQDS